MKRYQKDLVILLLPVIIMLLLTPILPDQIPMQFNLKGEVNWYLPKQLAFLLGFIPYVIYAGMKQKQNRRS